MKSLYTNGLLIVLMLVTDGCSRTGQRGTPGSGTAKTETRVVDAFKELEFIGGGTIEITMGSPQSLIITCDDNLLPLIETKVTEGRLVVRPLKKIRDFHLVVKATVADICLLTIDGAAKADLRGLDNKQLDIHLQGAAHVNVRGKTEKCVISTSGAGNINTSQLMARDVKVDISGAGNVDVHATDTLDVSISGLGSVRYTGEPNVKKSISGLGTVTQNHNDGRG